MKTKIPTLSKLIADCKFDWVSPNIKDGVFPEPTEIGTDYKLYHFDRYISSEDARQEMTNEGYRPATIHELLLWKDWNDKDLIVALGSVCTVDGSRDVPSLGRDASKRDLNLYWWVIVCYARCRFLAVRNLSLETKKLGTSDSVSLALGYLEAAQEAIKKAKKLLT